MGAWRPWHVPRFQVGGQPGMFLNSALKCSLTVQHFLLFFLLISTQAGNRLVWSLFVLGRLCRIVTFLLMWAGWGAVGLGFLGSSAGKESTCSAGDPILIPGLGKSLEKE